MAERLSRMRALEGAKPFHHEEALTSEGERDPRRAVRTQEHPAAGRRARKEQPQQSLKEADSWDAGMRRQLQLWTTVIEDSAGSKERPAEARVGSRVEELSGAAASGQVEVGS